MTLTKNIFREKSLKKIKNLPKYNKLYRNKLIQRKLFSVLQKLDIESILFYYPLDLEADIRAVMLKMAKKHTVYLPFMEGKSFKMVPFRLPLHRKKFGIMEPGNTIRKIKHVDAVVVPIVACDGNLQRIGFGKGMYDRFFSRLQKIPYTIFVQQVLCHTDKKICDPYDISCDIVITANATLYNKRKMQRI